ncbi:MAG TPA: type II toxin-antitoxin system PemK/MazF family toxin [Candidatus Saccharimonadales bacterium]|nr:type II toxin-antitoxin system PemK/MazF family toxin [Candidatus Saccharimonadales bacterium]
MGKFVVGDVVAVPFPFSDLSGNKLRPAVVLALVEHRDLILCQVTSKSSASNKAIKLSSSDFSDGSLPVTSYVRPDKLFTAEETIIQKRKGKLDLRLLHEVLTGVQALFAPEL